MVNDDGVFASHKDLGLVGDVFRQDGLDRLPRGTMAVGHTRYGTIGASSRRNCQPIEVNHQKGHMVIAPGQEHRLDQVRLKLSAIREAVSGKRVVLVDDSIVRGTTSARIAALLREAGAKEIHLRVSAPPFLNPCYYGTDIDSRENLIACQPEFQRQITNFPRRTSEGRRRPHLPPRRQR